MIIILYANTARQCCTVSNQLLPIDPICHLFARRSPYQYESQTKVNEVRKETYCQVISAREESPDVLVAVGNINYITIHPFHLSTDSWFIISLVSTSTPISTPTPTPTPTVTVTPTLTRTSFPTLTSILPLPLLLSFLLLNLPSTLKFSHPLTHTPTPALSPTSAHSRTNSYA